MKKWKVVISVVEDNMFTTVVEEYEAGEPGIALNLAMSDYPGSDSYVVMDGGKKVDSWLR